MITLALGFAAAVALAASAVLSKRLTLSMPARQLVGPLLLLNGVLVAPLAFLGGWVWSREALVLHLIEAVLLLVGSIAVWDLYSHGEASAAITAQSLSPLPALAAVVLLLPATFLVTDALGAAVVVAGVFFALSGAFPGLGRHRRWFTVFLAAATGGLLTVTSRLLADLGVGVVATYLTRTLLAAGVVLLLEPPHDIPWRELPRLLGRAAVITTHFVLVLLAVRTGSPAVVQTMVGTSPLLTLAYERARERRPVSIRVVGGTLAVWIGVGLIAAGSR